jgi:hypothetical protein
VSDDGTHSCAATGPDPAGSGHFPHPGHPWPAKGGNQTNEAQRTSAYLRGGLNATPGTSRDAHATLGPRRRSSTAVPYMRRAMRRGAAWTVERYQVAAWSLPWLRVGGAGSVAIAEPALVCQAANAGLTAGFGVSRRAALADVAIEDVRVPSVPFVRSLSASLLVRHGVPGGGDGVRPDTTGHAVSGRLSDRGVHCGLRTRPRGHGDQACGRSGIEHGCRWSRRVGPGAGDGWGWPKASMRIPVLAGQGGGWSGSVVGRGRLARRMVGRWAVEVSAAWPSPSGPGPYPRLGGHLELGCPDGREFRHVRRPASHGRVSAEATGRRRWVSRRVSGGPTLAEAGGQPDCGHVRHATGGGPRGAHQAIEDWVRGPTSGSGAETYFPPPIGRRTIVGGGVGQWVSVSGSRVSALAAGGSFAGG